MLKQSFTPDESRQIIEAFDTIISIAGGAKIMDVLNKLDRSGIPTAMQGSFMNTVAQEIGSSIGTAVSEWTTTMMKVTESPDQIQDLLQKLKK